MNPVFTIYSAFFLATAFVSFHVANLARKRRKVKGGTELALLMLTAGIWAILIMFETAAPTLQDKIFWSKLAYFGAVSTPVLYLIFVLRFTGKEKYLSLKYVLLMFIVPALTLVLTITNEKHSLIWPGFSPISATTNLMEYQHGPGFWIGYMAYNNLLLILATFYLYGFIMHHMKTFRSQGWVVFVACLCPWSASVLYITRTNPVPGLDLVPVSIILSGALLVYSILHIRFLDLAPVARETLVETLPDGILALDEQNRIQDINETALVMLGIRNKNILGLDVELSGANGRELLNAAIALESFDQFEFQGSDGTKTFKILKQPIKKHPGSRLVVMRDISDQVSRQQEVRAGEARYRHMFGMFRLMADNMPDMLWAKDLDKRFIFVNKAVCENLIQATDTDEPIGKSDLFFAERERNKHPERSDWHTLGELCQDSDQIVIESGKPERFDEYGNVKGRFLFLDVRKAPIFNENGEMIGVVGSARDVTKQKKSDTEIQKRDDLLDAIAKATAMLVKFETFGDNINTALEIIGKATKVNRVYIFRNHDDPGFEMPLMSQVYEWTDGSVDPQIDNPDLQDVPYEMACPRWFETLSAGKVIVGNIREFPEPEKTLLSAQGIKSILATPVFVDNSYWGFIGFDDCSNEREWLITEERILTAAASTIGAAFLRKKNQDELIAAKEKAEESDRLKSAFLTNMSHEIRTPMNGILGFISLLQESDLTGEEKDEYIRIVKKSGDRLLNTLHDIIDIAKIESGQMSVSMTDVNMNELNMLLHSFFKQEAETKGLQIFLTNSIPDEQALVNTDRQKLNSIMSNLIKNAIKYTNNGFVEFGCKKRDGFNEFFVKDTGIGIPEGKHQSIFERFVQVDSSHSRPYEGSGLGLAIAKAYVEMLGGRIQVESENGKGTTFTFQIPCTNQKRATDFPVPETFSPAKAAYRPMKILVTEDDQVNFSYIQIILRKSGHTLIHSITGTEAIALCHLHNDIDLILMDIKLPDMDGYEVTREIRKFNNETPIIALTAYAFEGDREKAIEAGCNDYLSKPVKSNTLLMTISKYQA